MSYNEKYPYDKSLKNWLSEDMKHCNLCPRLVNCRQAIYPGYGNKKAVAVFIGQNPGMVFRPITGISFRGNRTGDMFQDYLKRFNLKFDEIYTTNLVKCGPGEYNYKGFIPNEEEIAACSDYLITEMELIKPYLIITIGSLAKNYLPSSEAIDSAIKTHLWHPGYVLRSPGLRRRYDKMWDAVASEIYRLTEIKLSLTTAKITKWLK